MLYYIFRFLNETYFLSNSWQSVMLVNLFISTKQFQNCLSITHFFAFRLQRNKSWNRHLFWTCFIIYFLIFKVITRLIRYIHRPEGFGHFNRDNVHVCWVITCWENWIRKFQKDICLWRIWEHSSKCNAEHSE